MIDELSLLYCRVIHQIGAVKLSLCITKTYIIKTTIYVLANYLSYFYLFYQQRFL